MWRTRKPIFSTNTSVWVCIKGRKHREVVIQSFLHEPSSYTIRHPKFQKKFCRKKPLRSKIRSVWTLKEADLRFITEAFWERGSAATSGSSPHPPGSQKGGGYTPGWTSGRKVTALALKQRPDQIQHFGSSGALMAACRVWSCICPVSGDIKAGYQIFWVVGLLPSRRLPAQRLYWIF